MSEAVLNHVWLSWVILEAILGSLKPFWGHLVPSWALQLLATPPCRCRGGIQTPSMGRGGFGRGDLEYR
eukprot:8111620-Pyramimonas_sp.AAC.1